MFRKPIKHCTLAMLNEIVSVFSGVDNLILTRIASYILVEVGTMKTSLFGLLLLLLSCFVGAFAQNAAQNQSPPKVLMIVREEIKPGMMPAHNKHSANFANIFSKLPTSNHRLALVAVAGNENEVIYLNPGDSFAELERVIKETDAKLSVAQPSLQAELNRLNKEAPELHTGTRDLLATYRPDLSYDPDVDIAAVRYFAITTVRVRVGLEDQYADYVKNMLNTARTKIKAELHLAAYQIIAGAPTTTYMFLRPMKSLAEYDLRIGPRVREAMTDEQRKKADRSIWESLVITETSVYLVNPSMSYVEKEIVARDQTFWGPKPEVAATGPKPKKRSAQLQPRKSRL